MAFVGHLLFKTGPPAWLTHTPHPRDKKPSITPAAECKAEGSASPRASSPPLRWQNQQRGLLNWGRRSQKSRGRCSHNGQYQHAATAAQPRHERKVERRPSSSPGIWTSEQSRSCCTGPARSTIQIRDSRAQRNGVLRRAGGEKHPENSRKLCGARRPAALFNFNRLADVNPQ